MKGIVAVALVAAIAVIVIWGFILNVLIGGRISWEEVAKETEIVKAVNKVESVKRGLPYALYYSYLEALKRSGYNSYSQVEDKDDFKASILSVFLEYKTELEEKSNIKIPGGSIGLQEGEELIISFLPDSLLTYEYSSPGLSFKISDNSSISIKIKNDQLLEQF